MPPNPLAAIQVVYWLIHGLIKSLTTICFDSRKSYTKSVSYTPNSNPIEGLV